MAEMLTVLLHISCTYGCSCSKQDVAKTNGKVITEEQGAEIKKILKKTAEESRSVYKMGQVTEETVKCSFVVLYVVYSTVQYFLPPPLPY